MFASREASIDTGHPHWGQGRRFNEQTKFEQKNAEKRNDKYCAKQQGDIGPIGGDYNEVAEA